MHYSLLIGYGASAINPYLAVETLENLAENNQLPDGLTLEKALKNYKKAVNKGLLKVFSKMGISTLQSYRGAQIFEAIGLSQSLVDKYFSGTASRIEGIASTSSPKRPAANTPTHSPPSPTAKPASTSAALTPGAPAANTTSSTPPPSPNSSIRSSRTVTPPTRNTPLA